MRSSNESEYIALSRSLRDGLPMQRVVQYVSTVFSFLKHLMITSCRVYEDMDSAVALTSGPKYRHRTKHIVIE